MFFLLLFEQFWLFIALNANLFRCNPVQEIPSKYKDKQCAVSSPAYCEIKCYVKSGLQKYLF